MSGSKHLRRLRPLGLVALAALAVGASGPVTAAGDAASSPLRVEDFRLPDQHYLARQLYRMGDAKAVVIFTYAAGDPAVKRDAPALMALKAAYAPRGVEFVGLDSKLVAAIVAEAKASVYGMLRGDASMLDQLREVRQAIFAFVE